MYTDGISGKHFTFKYEWTVILGYGPFGSAFTTSLSMLITFPSKVFPLCLSSKQNCWSIIFSFSLLYLQSQSQNLNGGRLRCQGRHRYFLCVYMYCWLRPVFWVHGLWPLCYGCHLNVTVLSPHSVYCLSRFCVVSRIHRCFTSPALLRPV